MNMGTGAESAPGARRLPTPEEWSSQRPARVLVAAVIGLGLMTVAALGGAGWALLSGRSAPGLVLLGVAFVLGHVCGLGVSTLWTPRGNGSPGKLVTCPVGHDHRSVAFRYSLWPYYWLTATLVVTIAVVGVFAVVPATSGGGGPLALAAALAMLILAVSWFLIVMLWLAPGRVVLCPDGVFHRGLAFTHFVPWFAIYDVAAGWDGVPMIVVKASPSDGTWLRRYTGGFGTAETRFLPFLVVRNRWLASDPTILLHALRYYHDHPDARVELASPAGVNRIDAGGLV